MDSRQLWERYTGCYDYLAGVESYRTGLSEVADVVPLNSGLRVLDAGSGTGNLSLILKERGAEVVSCDFSAAALARHRRKDAGARTVQASLEEPLPFSAASFHAVYCVSVLFALSRAGCELAIHEFHRVLRPGGRLVITVAAPEKQNRRIVRTHLRNLQDAHGRVGGTLRFLARLPDLLRLLHYNRCLQRMPDWQGYHRFAEDELRALLTGAGFAIYRIGRTYAGSFFLVECGKDRRCMILGAARHQGRSYSQS